VAFKYPHVDGLAFYTRNAQGVLSRVSTPCPTVNGTRQLLLELQLVGKGPGICFEETESDPRPIQAIDG
jgi:hypothetical protein